VKAFLDRLLQRSRGEASSAMPYRKPLFNPNYASQSDVTATALTTPAAHGYQPVTDDGAPSQYNVEPRLIESAEQKLFSRSPTAQPLVQGAYRPIQSASEPSRASSVPPATMQPGFEYHLAKPQMPVTPSQLDDTYRLRETSTTPDMPIRNHRLDVPDRPVVSSAQPLQRAVPLPPEVPAQPRVGTTSPVKPRSSRSSQPAFINPPDTDAPAQSIDVHVYIGRIDIRATPQQAPQPKAAAKTVPPTLTLNDYIQQRSGGKR
jgi:hypothetical protein